MQRRVGNRAAATRERSHSKPYPMPPLPVKSGGVILERAARKLGWHPFPSPMAILSEPRPGRSACVQCGFCESFGVRAAHFEKIENWKLRPLDQWRPRVRRPSWPDNSGLGVNVYTEYTDPKRTKWITKIQPTLRKAKLAVLIKACGKRLSRREIIELRAGRKKPHRRTQRLLESLLKRLDFRST